MSNLTAWLHHTKRHRTSNGLTVLTHKLPNSGVAALHFCVKAGYFCETDREVGLAHLLEHMYFKGSEKYPVPESMGVQMKALGGMINATTSYDQTCYFCEVPAKNLEQALAIMTDAFLAPNFPADELTRETEVVIEEFNRKLDSPASYSVEMMIQLAYTTHRMKRWRIGTPEQLRSYTRDDLFDYFRRYYQPQNMVITVSGNFDEDSVIRKIEEDFSRMPNRELVKDFGPVEPPQNGLRYALHKAAATQSYLHLAFHVPGVRSDEQPALDFLTSLLSSGKSARLHRYVVEQRRSASAVSCGVMAYEDVGLMVVSAVTETEKIRDAARDIWTVFEDLFSNGITEGELQKVKNKLKLHQAMQTEDAMELAELLSYHESYDGYEKIEEYLNAMNALTEEQIIATARKHIKTSNLTVHEFVNEELAPADPQEYERKLTEGYAAPEVVLPPPMVLQESEMRPATAAAQAPDLIKDGVTYILQPDPHHPFVAAGIFFLGGRNEESDENAGITHLTFRSLLKGTSKLDAEQIAFRFDALGNPPRFSCSRDVSGFTFETLPESFAEMWDLLVHCLSDARFPDKEVDTERGKVLSMIRRNLDDNFVRPLQLFQRAYYGSHPYGIPETGFEETVNKLTSADLAAWRARLLSESRIVVAAVGNFDGDHLLSILQNSLKTLSLNESPLVAPPMVHVPSRPEQSEQRPKKQTAFVLGFPAPPATSDDVIQYEVLQQVLSGMGGRLFINLRSKKSLAYTVYAGTASYLYSGTFLTYIAGDASKERQALEGMWEELETLQRSAVTDEELQNARNALIGGYALGTQGASARLMDYVNSYLLGRPMPYAPIYEERVRTVTAEKLLHAARRTFLRDAATLGILRGTTEMTDAEKLVLA